MYNVNTVKYSSNDLNKWLGNCYSEAQEPIAKLFDRNNLILIAQLDGIGIRDIGTYNRFKCKIKNLDNDESYYFEFHDSIANYEKNILKPNAYDLLTSLACDASSYSSCSGFDDFCDNYFFDAKLSEYPKAVKMYEECEKCYKSLELILDDLDLLFEIQ